MSWTRQSSTVATTANVCAVPGPTPSRASTAYARVHGRSPLLHACRRPGRRPAPPEALVVDDGAIAALVRELAPGGVDAALELVGTPTLRDSLEATRVHGVVCGAGYLSNEWIVPNFYPTGFLPNGVHLTGYGGDASDLPHAVLQEFLDAVAAGEATVPIAKTYVMEEIATAHDDMEHDRVAGKLVVSTGR